MPSAEFWNLTPYQISALIERDEQDERRWDVRFASLWWRYVNGHRKQGDRVIPFDEMFPELSRTETGHNVSRVQTPEQQKYMLDMWLATMPEGMVVHGKRPARDA